MAKIPNWIWVSYLLASIQFFPNFAPYFSALQLGGNFNLA